MNDHGAAFALERILVCMFFRRDPLKTLYSKEELLFQVVLYKIAFTAMLDGTLVALSS